MVSYGEWSRGQLGRGEESCVIIHHDESPCMTHGEAMLLVLRLAESVCVIPWPLVWWCKGTYGGASLRDFGVCGAKASHHTPRHTSPRLPIPRCVPLHHRRRDRDQLGRDEESCVITYHNESSCMTRGGVDMLVLCPGENASAIAWPLVR